MPQTEERAAGSDDATRRRGARAPRGRGAGEVRRQVVGLLRAAHLRQAFLIAVVVGAAVALTGRSAREAVLAGVAVLVVQAIAGLGNDVADAERDSEAQTPGKPVAAGVVPAPNASFVALCLAVLSVPLSLQNGTVAGASLLLCLPVAWLYNRRLRRTALSPLPWIVTGGLLLAFVAYGGPGWGLWGAPPTLAMTAAVAVLAVGVHFLTSLPDLVADNRTGVRHLPLRVALKTGAPRLLLMSGVVTVAAVVACLLVALGPGLRQG